MTTFGSLINLSSIHAQEVSKTLPSARTDQKAIDIIVINPEPFSYRPSFSFLGSLETGEQTQISAEIGGLIREISFKDGQRVKKGDVLVRLDDKRQQANLALAKANAQATWADASRLKELSLQNATSQKSLEQAEAALKQNEAQIALAEADLEKTVIRSPFSGRLTRRLIDTGTVIAAGQTVIETVADSPYLNLFIPATLSAHQLLNQDIQGQLMGDNQGSLPLILKATLVYIAPVVSPDTQRLAARAQIKEVVSSDTNKTVDFSVLRAGQSVTGEVFLQNIPLSVWKIPERALVYSEKGASVVKVLSDGSVQSTPIIIRKREKNFVYAEGDLSETVPLVFTGHEHLKKGIKANPIQADKSIVEGLL